MTTTSKANTTKARAEMLSARATVANVSVEEKVGVVLLVGIYSPALMDKTVGCTADGFLARIDEISLATPAE